MKITREGQVPVSASTPWWVGKTAECRTCGVQVTLEEGDNRPTKDHAGKADSEQKPLRLPLISEHGERHPGGRQWISGVCPTTGCPGLLELENVFKSQLSGAAAAQEFNPKPAKA